MLPWGQCEVFSVRVFFVLMQFLVYWHPHLGLDLLASVHVVSVVSIMPSLLQDKHLLNFFVLNWNVQRD